MLQSPTNMAPRSREFVGLIRTLNVILAIVICLLHHSKANIFLETEEEFCNMDTFSARCPAGHVIEVTQAIFGRMRRSRCVTNDVMESCDVDALHVLHPQCSGLRECTMDVSEIDKLLVNSTQPVCTNDYRLHLYSSYRCIPVETEPSQRCLTADHGPHPIELSSTEGYLASLTTRETGKGSERCPWHISAQPGQTVQIYLQNYNSQVKPSTMCHIYAYIRERALPSSQSKLMDCGYDSLHRTIFNSLSDSLDVIVVDPDGDRNFVLYYKAMGCPNVAAVEGADIVRKGNKTIVSCDQGEWTLTCQNGQWIGDKGSCVTTGRTQSATFPWPTSWTQEFTIVLIITVALLIAVIIVVAGVCIVRKNTSGGFQPVPQRVGEYGVYGLRGPVVPSKCYYPTLSLPRGGSVCQGSGSDSSHYTTTMQRRQAVPGSIVPPVDGFAPHFLQQTDLTSCASCPVHSCSVSRAGTYHDRVGASGWQTFPVRRPDHIYASPKLSRRAHEPPYYHELDRAEVERQLRLQQAAPEQVAAPTPGIPWAPRDTDQSPAPPRIPTEDELGSEDGLEDPLPPPPPPLPPDNQS